MNRMNVERDRDGRRDWSEVSVKITEEEGLSSRLTVMLSTINCT